MSMLYKFWCKVLGHDWQLAYGGEICKRCHELQLKEIETDQWDFM
jgi:hypothetical protein